MRTLTLAAVLALLGAVSAVPITPAAPEHQYLAESMRSEGISEVNPTSVLLLNTP